MKEIIKVISFPLFFFGAVTLYRYLCIIGWPLELAVAFVVILYSIHLEILERIIPYRKKWRKSQDDILTDICHFTFNSLLQPFIILTVISLYSRMGTRLEDAMGLALWNRDLPFAIQLSFALVLREFFQYWLHRITHEHDSFLRRFHAIHHSAHRLYWFNANRIHIMNILFNVSCGLGAVIFLNPGMHIVYGVILVIGLITPAQHANIDFRLGFLNWIFSCTDVHRWHHSTVAAEQNQNYGNVLVIWDLVFGTYFNPAGRQVGEIGNVGTQLPQNFLGQVLFPVLRKYSLTAQLRWFDDAG